MYTRDYVYSGIRIFSNMHTILEYVVSFIPLNGIGPRMAGISVCRDFEAPDESWGFLTLCKGDHVLVLLEFLDDDWVYAQVADRLDEVI